jgi:hypothetical protein
MDEQAHACVEVRMTVCIYADVCSMESMELSKVCLHVNQSCCCRLSQSLKAPPRACPLTSVDERFQLRQHFTRTRTSTCLTASLLPAIYHPLEATLSATPLIQYIPHPAHSLPNEVLCAAHQSARPTNTMPDVRALYHRADGCIPRGLSTDMRLQVKRTVKLVTEQHITYAYNTRFLLLPGQH